MIRYSTLYGTDQSGHYGRQGNSPKLRDFLEREIGGSVDAIVQEVEKVTRPMLFEYHPGYDKERLDNKPVAVRYAPMHLYRLENMPKNMKEFCVMGVAGSEHREDTQRTIFYTHTHVFPVSNLLKSGKYNYLDQLFGTRYTSWADVKAHREGKRRMSFDSLPEKVYPMIREDREWVLKALTALFSDKRVVLRLEEGTHFNQRARDLLMQIYSLLPPGWALETGFATYQRMEEIEGLEKTSIRIYVIPAGVKTEGLSPSRYQVLDLGSGDVSPAADNELVQVMKVWMSMGWNERQSVMEALFARHEHGADTETFIKTSTQYFQAKKEFDAWLAQNAKQLKSLEDVAVAFQKVKPLAAVLPNWRELLKAGVPGMLADGVKVEQLNVKAVADLFFDPDSTPRKNQYAFGMALGGVDHNALSAEVSKRQRAMDAVALEEEKAAHTADNEKHALAMTTAVAAHNDEMNRVKADHAEAIRAKDQTIAERDAAHEAAMARTAADHEAAIQARDAAHAEAIQAKDQAIAEAEQKHAQQLEAMKNACAKAINDQAAAHKTEKENLVLSHNEAMTAAKNEFQLQLSGEQENTRLAKEEALREKEKADGLQTSLTQAQGTLNAMNRKLAETNDELTRVSNNLTTMTIERDDAKDRLKHSDGLLADATRKLNLAINTLINAQANGGVLPEDAVDPAELSAGGGSVSGGGRSGGRSGGRFTKGKRDMKELIIAAVAGLAAGLLLMGLIWGIVGAVSGGEETLPVESTLPSETTVPPETTLPPETTVPPETTLPPETTVPPTEPALNEVNWEEALADGEMTNYIDDENTVTNLLGDYTPITGAQVLGIVTNDEDGFGEHGTTLPESFVVVLLKEETDRMFPVVNAVTDIEGDGTEENPSEEPTESVPAETGEGISEGETGEPLTGAEEPKALEQEASMIVQGEHYCLVVLGGDSIQSAAMKLFGFLNPEEDVQVSLTVNTPDGGVLDLTELLAQSMETENWWNQVQSVSFESMDCVYGQTILSSSRTPVAVVFCGENSVFVYDYRDDAENADKMLEIQQGHGRGAALVDGYVAVCHIPATPEPTDTTEG